MFGRRWLMLAAALGASWAAVGDARGSEIITIAGAGAEGRWFKEASMVSQLINEHNPDLHLNPVTGRGASEGNILRLGADRIQAGRFFLQDLEKAYAGNAPFDNTTYDGEVVVWMAMGSSMFRVLAPPEVEHFSDLRGLRVAVGNRGSGDHETAAAILGAFGVDESNTTFVFQDRAAAGAAIANRQIDAWAFLLTRNNRSHFSPIFAARPLGTDLDFVEPDPDMIDQALAELPSFHLDEGGEPAFERPDLPAIAVANGLAIRADLDEDVVYRMTKTIFEHFDTLVAQEPLYSQPGEFSPELAPTIQNFPYHPGAVRYYREAGLM